MAGSGQLLYDRRCRVTILTPVSTPNDFKTTTTDVLEINAGATDDKAVAGLRVSFKISKTLKKEPNTAEIVVTNLNPQHRANLQQKGVRLQLEAGYKQTGVVRYWAGDVRTVDHVRNGAQWDTTFRIGDGERAWRYARVNESFAPGTPTASVVNTIATAMGINAGNLDKQLSSITGTMDQGWGAAGSASRELDRLLKSIGKTWSIQDNELQILDPYATLDLPVPVISETSGLLDSPQMGSPPKKGQPALVKFKSLLIPTKPGAKVKLESERYNGFVRVVAVTFTGDTAGGEWSTEICGTLLST